MQQQVFFPEDEAFPCVDLFHAVRSSVRFVSHKQVRAFSQWCSYLRRSVSSDKLIFNNCSRTWFEVFLHSICNSCLNISIHPKILILQVVQKHLEAYIG